MTTKERLELELERLEKEQNEIIELLKGNCSIDFIISLGRQALKNKETMSFARSMIRDK